MDKFDNEQLISLVEVRPVLWDKQAEDFKDKHLKIANWRDVCLTFNKDFDTMEEKQRQEYGKLIQRKWAGLRDTWVRRRKEQNVEKCSGSGARKTRPYIYDQQLSFLTKVYSESPNVVDSIVIDEDVDSIDKDITLDEHLDTGVQKPATVNKRKLPVRNELDNKMMKFIDHQMNVPSKINAEEENRHLAFFKGLLPSVNKFDDDQSLEFQAGVIALIQKIKNKRQLNSYVVHQHDQYIPTPISSTPSPYSNDSDLSFLDL